MHVFTFAQIAALACLWTVSKSKVALAFPFVLIMVIPVRKQMEKMFTPLELRAVRRFRFFLKLISFVFTFRQLDGSQANEGAEDEPDFYEQSSLPA